MMGGPDARIRRIGEVPLTQARIDGPIAWRKFIGNLALKCIAAFYPIL